MKTKINKKSRVKEVADEKSKDQEMKENFLRLLDLIFMEIKNFELSIGEVRGFVKEGILNNYTKKNMEHLLMDTRELSNQVSDVSDFRYAIFMSLYEERNRREKVSRQSKNKGVKQ